jgi:hypothetical protein
MNLSSIFGGFLYYQKTNDYGIANTNPAISAYNQFLAGEITMVEFLDVFNANCPFAPLCFRSGAVIFSRNLSGTNGIYAGDVFGGVEGWTLS